ncbi:MAG: hypothetical protein IRZ02_07720 [Acidothermus sp.]|nr:hypothetical protein [Acidothermus sp.]MCL6538327.1 hypothetical protein [Acidothermus sp.]
MIRIRRVRPDRQPSFEELLAPSGDRALPDDGWARVSMILQAASAPAHPQEHADERLFVATFRQEVAQARAARRRVPVGVRRFAGAFGGLATTCAALATAAYASALPPHLQSAAHRLIGAPAPQVTSSVEASAPAPTDTPRPSLRPVPSTPPTVARGLPTVSAQGLCAAWTAVEHSDGPTPAGLRTALSRLAGDDSPDQIRAYCTGILGNGEAAGNGSGHPGSGNEQSGGRGNEDHATTSPENSTESDGKGNGSHEEHSGNPHGSEGDHGNGASHGNGPPEELPPGPNS